jgi:ABC-type antimicrobial peptide transport system permease subunit
MGGAPISVIPPWLVLFALIFSTGIGLVAGYLPARRATRLSALEAIKTE